MHSASGHIEQPEKVEHLWSHLLLPWTRRQLLAVLRFYKEQMKVREGKYFTEGHAGSKEPEISTLSDFRLCTGLCAVSLLIKVNIQSNNEALSELRRICLERENHERLLHWFVHLCPSAGSHQDLQETNLGERQDMVVLRALSKDPWGITELHGPKDTIYSPQSDLKPGLTKIIHSLKPQESPSLPGFLINVVSLRIFLSCSLLSWSNIIDYISIFLPALVNRWTLKHWF